MPKIMEKSNFGNKMFYKALGFDYSGVIFGLPGSAFMDSIAELLNVSTDDLKRKFFENQHLVNIEKSLDWIQLWERIATGLGHSEKHKQVRNIIEDYENNKKINQKIINLIKKLRSTGYKIGLLSNYGVELREQLKSQGIAEYFDVIGISSEMGAMKPQPEAFVKFCSMLGVKTDELIYIDDSTKNIKNAGDIGNEAILFRNFDDLHEKLVELKVL